MLAGYVPLACQSPYRIIVYFLANYRPHLSHVLENVILMLKLMLKRTKLDTKRLKLPFAMFDDTVKI